MMRSDRIKKGPERGPHRSLLKATGLTGAQLLEGHVHRDLSVAGNLDFRTGFFQHKGNQPLIIRAILGQEDSTIELDLVALLERNFRGEIDLLE